MSMLWWLLVLAIALADQLWKRPMITDLRPMLLVLLLSLLLELLYEELLLLSC